MWAKISFLRETSDHDGYCSGAECEYEHELQTVVVKLSELPPQITFKNGFVEKAHLNLELWEQYLPEYSCEFTENTGSGFCDVSDESDEHGLWKHDVRDTIVSIKRLRQKM